MQLSTLTGFTAVSTCLFVRVYTFPVLLLTCSGLLKGFRTLWLHALQLALCQILAGRHQRPLAPPTPTYQPALPLALQDWPSKYVCASAVSSNVFVGQHNAY